MNFRKFFRTNKELSNHFRQRGGKSNGETFKNLVLDSGGKREWVYTNIRVKPHAQAAFNKAVEGSDQSWMASNQSNPTESGPRIGTKSYIRSFEYQIFLYLNMMKF